MSKIPSNNPEEWRKVIELTEQMQHGQITIKVQAGKISIEEYTIKRKPGEDTPPEMITRVL